MVPIVVFSQNTEAPGSGNFVFSSVTTPVTVKVFSWELANVPANTKMQNREMAFI
jgi:hypothetical protein